VKETAKRFMVLVGMLAALLAAAVPALAESEPVLTGTLGPAQQCPAVEDASCPDYGMTDETSGTYYGILSEEDLGIYEGQRVNVFFDGTAAQSNPPLVRATRVEPAEGPPPGPTPGSSATFTYELAVECEPPADAEFFGLTATESLVTTPLTDPDGDGVYTGSQTVPRFAPGGPPEPITISPVRIVQGPPTAAGPLGPEYRVIKDFGAVVAEDATFSASVSYCDGGPGGNGGGFGGVVSGDTNDDEGGDVVSPGGVRVLPETGGAALALVGALLLTAAGLLMRRATR
jgi:hypothetical protein